MDTDRPPARARVCARRAYEIARLCESWPLLVAVVAFGVLGVALGAPARVSVCVAAVLAGLCILSQWWRSTAGDSCACGLVVGGAPLIVLGATRVCGTDAVVTTREDALAAACIVVVLFAVGAWAAAKSRHWSYWVTATVAFSLTHVLVVRAALCR